MNAQKEIAEAVRRYRDVAYNQYRNAKSDEAQAKNYKKYEDLQKLYQDVRDGKFQRVEEKVDEAAEAKKFFDDHFKIVVVN
jgi:hypothetical protein